MNENQFNQAIAVEMNVFISTGRVVRQFNKFVYRRKVDFNGIHYIQKTSLLAFVRYAS